MRKQVFGRQFNRDANERKALFKTLASSLVLHERIETTEAKAKAIRPYIEKLVTKAKRRNNEARQFIEPYLSKEASEKIITDMAVRFANRNGGYTRIIRLGSRFADNAPYVLMEWVEKTSASKVSLKVKKEKKQPEKKTAQTSKTSKPAVKKPVKKKETK